MKASTRKLCKKASNISDPHLPLRPDRVQPYRHSFFPEGIRKTRGIVNKNPRPTERKLIVNPWVGVELK
jgi:hypothetical protein